MYGLCDKAGVDVDWLVGDFASELASLTIAAELGDAIAVRSIGEELVGRYGAAVGRKVDGDSD